MRGAKWETWSPQYFLFTLVCSQQICRKRDTCSRTRFATHTTSGYLYYCKTPHHWFGDVHIVQPACWIASTTETRHVDDVCEFVVRRRRRRSVLLICVCFVWCSLYRQDKSPWKPLMRTPIDAWPNNPCICCVCSSTHTCAAAVCVLVNIKQP